MEKIKVKEIKKFLGKKNINYMEVTDTIGGDKILKIIVVTSENYNYKRMQFFEVYSIHNYEGNNNIVFDCNPQITKIIKALPKESEIIINIANKSIDVYQSGNNTIISKIDIENYLDEIKVDDMLTWVKNSRYEVYENFSILKDDFDLMIKSMVADKLDPPIIYNCKVTKEKGNDTIKVIKTNGIFLQAYSVYTLDDIEIKKLIPLELCIKFIKNRDKKGVSVYFFGSSKNYLYMQERNYSAFVLCEDYNDFPNIDRIYPDKSKSSAIIHTKVETMIKNLESQIISLAGNTDYNTFFEKIGDKMYLSNSFNKDYKIELNNTDFFSKEFNNIYFNVNYFLKLLETFDSKTSSIDIVLIDYNFPILVEDIYHNEKYFILMIISGN
jgi:hypothetical protein